VKKGMKNGNTYLIIGFVVMAVLFYSSSQSYEEQSQIGLLTVLLKNEPFKEWLSKISFIYADSEVSIQAKGYFAFIEFFVRKFAHFGTYFVLATGYAGMDEFHQMMTNGRTPLFQDVMLDSVGALTAVLLCWMFIGFRQQRIF
jgi:VanZ family protein